jgi:hypothetical protein
VIEERHVLRSGYGEARVTAQADIVKRDPQVPDAMRLRHFLRRVIRIIINDHDLARGVDERRLEYAGNRDNQKARAIPSRDDYSNFRRTLTISKGHHEKPQSGDIRGKSQLQIWSIRRFEQPFGMISSDADCACVTV